MAWTLIDDIGTYLSAVGELLGSQPERYTVLSTVLDSLAEQGPHVYGPASPVLGTWEEEGVVRAAVLQTPPHPLHITQLPADSVVPLAAALAPGNASGITTVVGGEAEAVAFADAWCAATGTRFRVQMRQRLYRLGELVPPDPPPAGAPRIATTADSRIVRSWDEEFGAETGTGQGSPAMIEARLRRGRLVLWEVAGEPVSAAGVTEVVGGVARVGQVYTPPAYRNRGYGGAVTAAATQHAFDQGATSVVLFTDLSNSTSNSLYRKLGYEPVEDKVLLAFDRDT
jgi:RimJ/RimL family protein N-acetyltransferase